jgi:radical SAM protein with 4Fe4S-binding SPASM domain
LWRDLRAALSDGEPLSSPPAGLLTYRVANDYGERRLHLRVEPDGAGALFVDVTDVFHLNATAVLMANMELEEVPLPEARRRLLAAYRDVDRRRLDEELNQLYGLVEGLRTFDDGCPVCAVGDVRMEPLLSTPVSAPYKADLALTYGCNNACAHCYNEPDRYAMPSLPKEAWYQVIDRLGAVGVPHLILTGGEATLHPDLTAIIRYADARGHIVGLNTNGRRLAHMPTAQALADAGLNHVQVTLGSSRPDVHDAMMAARSFHQTVRGIRNALETRMHVITNTTLMRTNMDHVEEIVGFLYDMGLRTFAMNGMIYSGGGFAHPNAISEEEMPALLLRVRDAAEALGMRFLWYTPTEYCRLSPVELEIGAKRCNAGEYSICVEPNGDVLPCQSYYVAAGNILRDPWEAIWRSELFRSFRDREADPRWAGLPEKCWDCPDLPLCGGGCRIEREARLWVRLSAGGCSSCATGNQAPEPETGFVPLARLTRDAVRGQGSTLPERSNVGD